MTSVLKALVVGDFLSPIHEEAICKGLRANGVQVDEFKFSEYLKFNSVLRKKITNLQLKLQAGPAISRLNKSLNKKLSSTTYDFIFFYRPRIVKPKVLSAISPQTITFCYNNDDPFSPLYNKNYWETFFSCLKYFTHIFYYRQKNGDDYQKLGFYNTSLLRSYFIKTANFPVVSAKQYDVIFIGHYEDDDRDEWLKYLLENGVNLKLFGPEWHRSKYFTFFTKTMGKIKPLRKEYNEIINKTKIALVFLSTLNSDTYTRRCFEIPATGTFMLAWYTDDLASMFEAGKDADFFRSKEDLLEKIRYYLQNEEERERIAKAGHDRLLRDGHEVIDRTRQIIDTYKRIHADKNNH
jgi:spore maturation protein CgeB